MRRSNKNNSSQKSARTRRRPAVVVFSALLATTLVCGASVGLTSAHAANAMRPGGAGHGGSGPGGSFSMDSGMPFDLQDAWDSEYEIDDSDNSVDIDKVTTEVSPAASGATVLIYMNGSDLESYSAAATSDIEEMIKSNIGSNVNVIIETIGTQAWHRYGIASDHTQRYRVNQGKLELVDDSLGQLDTTSADTLSDFVSWGVKNYPADRYMLLLWDHGAGPVYGFGYDEFQSDYAALTLDEIKAALDANSNVHFDMIGMDCCLMSSLETCKVLAPYCDYTILSEDFEPGVGWSYTNWMSMLNQNPSIGIPELGKTIVDDMVRDTARDPENGNATLAVIDEKAIDELYSAWTKFAYANKDALLNTNFSQETTWYGRPDKALATNGGNGHGNSGNQHEGGFGEGYDGYANVMGDLFGEDVYDALSQGPFDSWDTDMSNVTMSDYFVTDILTVASSIDSEEATALKNAVQKAIVHYGQTDGEEGMTGIGVTLPYGDAEFYDELVKVFGNSGIDKDYIAWLEDFVNVPNAGGENVLEQDQGFYEDFGNGFDPFSEYVDDFGHNDGNGYDMSHGSANVAA